MSQPGIASFTQRVTRRTNRTKNTILDKNNTNIISLASKHFVTASPGKNLNKPEIHESSPAKIRRTTKYSAEGNKDAIQNEKSESVQAAFRRQLEGLKSPTKKDVTPEKFKINPINITPPKDTIPSIRRALKFDQPKKASSNIEPTISLPRPIMGGTIRRGKARTNSPVNTQIKTRNLFDEERVDPTRTSIKEILLSPKKIQKSAKVDTRSRAEIMLEQVVGKKTGKTLSIDQLRKQLQKSGKVNDLKAKLAQVKRIDSELRQVGSPKKKSSIACRSGPVPTALDKDAPCYVKYRHLAESGVMDKMKLPATYELLFSQYESNDQQVAVLYNRGEACIFIKIARAVMQVLSRDFGMKQLEQIMAISPDSYQVQWRKGLYDAKKGSARIKSSDYQLVLNPILENDENDLDEGAIRMSLKHITKRSRIFRQTLLGIVRNLHEKFLTSIGVDVSKLNKIKRWHPQFKLEECEEINTVKLPEKPGAADNALTACQLLEKMRESFPDKAKIAMEERKKELERIELAKITKQRAEEVAKGNTKKPAIPTHILAKIKAKQAANAEAVAESLDEKKIECGVLRQAPTAASIMRSYFITERKTCYPFDSACKKIKRSWKVPISVSHVEQLLNKVYELMPKLIEIKVVVGIKYIKLLDKNIDPVEIEKLCQERLDAISK